MKCIKHMPTGTIKRVKGHVAKGMVAYVPGFEYCPKSEWKEKVRDAGTISPPTTKELKRERKKARKFASMAEQRRYTRQMKKREAA